MSQGIDKVISYKAEATWGTKPSASGAQALRRVTGNFQLEKDTYQSNEINTSQQIKDFRHGTRRSTGSLSGELSGGAYEDFIAAALRKDFVAGATTGALTNVSSAESVGVSTFVRAAGSFITDGFKIGDIISVSGWTAPATANNKLYVVVGVVALTLTVEHFESDGLLVVKSAGDAVTIVARGKKTWIPITGHTDDSFSIEEWYPDSTISRVFTGQQVDTMAINLAPNAMATIDFGFLGKNGEPATSSQYFTSPTAQTGEGVYSGPDGVLIINGVANRLTTSLTLNVANGIVQEAVIGSNTIGAKSRGKVNVTGSLSSIFSDDDYLNYFDGETEVSVIYAMRSADRTEAFGVYMPRVKFGSGTTDDGEKVIILNSDYQALEDLSASSISEATTLRIQDTTL
jgi:hypothetical protein